MPKQAFPAAAEGMPNFNRRNFFQGVGSTAIVAGAFVVPAVAEAKQSRQAANEYYRATHSAKDRVVHHLVMAAQAMDEIARAEGKHWVILSCGDQAGVERFSAGTYAPPGAAEADENVYFWKRARP